MRISQPMLVKKRSLRRYTRSGLCLAVAGIVGWFGQSTAFAQGDTVPDSELDDLVNELDDEAQQEDAAREESAPEEPAAEEPAPEEPAAQEPAPEEPAAQEAPAPEPAAVPETPVPQEQMEQIEVTGTRATTRTSIQVKRSFDSIVDALAAEDIGDIPALSIGEAIETLPGASSHRDQGGATEISIRGMGPFLGSTVINGREATNGSGDRSVNFSQFPSELFSKIRIFKSQEARLIEGGVSGQIQLDTIKPLDFGKQRLQIALKGNYHPGNGNIENNVRNFGSRITVSYVDQFEADLLGNIGVSLGYQKRLTTNPEQEYRSSSQWRACRAEPNDPTGIFRTDADNCDRGNVGLVDLNVDPETGVAPDADSRFLFVPGSRSYRQNITDDDRESLFAAIQWQPTDSIDINFDVQVSDRTFTEDRNDLVFAEQRRITPGITAENLMFNTAGDVTVFANEQRIETNSTYQERIEDYIGGGLNLAFDLSERLRLTIDGSYSKTERQENIIQTRLQSDDVDIFGNPTPAGSDRIFTSIANPGTGSEVPLVTVRNFDVTNPDLFSNAARVRADLNQLRENTIAAVRADLEYKPEIDFLTRIRAGVRFSELGFKSFPRVRDEFDDFGTAATREANLACRNENFPESGFLDGPSGGQDLVTNIDDNDSTISSGSTYASFRARCLARELIGTLPGIPLEEPTVSNVDVTEQTIAGYLQADFFDVLFGKPIGGNIGLRVVNTNVESTGLRTTFTTRQGEQGLLLDQDQDNFTSVEGGSSYTEFLPSANFVMDLTDTVVSRLAVFRALSRPEPSAMGFGRTLSFANDDNAQTISDFVGSAQANGNPNLEPLTSWNFDIALEWYPNQDSLLAGVFYFKRFIGGFENAQTVETFQIDGQDVEANVTTQQTDENASNLYGIELSSAHTFSYLPSVLSGLGVRLNVNLAVSDFEFEDGTFGEAVIFNNGVEGQRVGIVEPANLFGFSSAVVSGQLFYGIGDLDLQFIVKHRSQYFQQFISTPGFIRYIDDNTVFEARATYKLTDNFTLRAEALNVLNEPRRHFNPTVANLAEVNSYGSRLFLGLRAKF